MPARLDVEEIPEKSGSSEYRIFYKRIGRRRRYYNINGSWTKRDGYRFVTRGVADLICFILRGRKGFHDE